MTDASVPVARREAVAAAASSRSANDGRPRSDLINSLAVDPEPRSAELPRHLRVAMQAAAAARDRAKRIRAGEAMSVPTGGRQQQFRDDLRGGWSPLTKPRQNGTAARPRFARTIAAADQLRSELSPSGTDDPLHLRLRDENAEPVRRAAWLRSLWAPLRRLAPTPKRLMLRYVREADEVDGEVACGSPDGAGSPVEPASLEALQLPPLGRRSFEDCELPSRAPAEAPAEQRDPPAPANAGQTVQCDTLDTAPPWPWLAPGAGGREATPSVLEARQHSSWPLSHHRTTALVAVPRNLPAKIEPGGPPAVQLRDLMSLRAPLAASINQEHTSITPKERRAEPAQPLHSRARAPLLALATALGLGCGLGAVAFPVAFDDWSSSDTRLDQAGLALDPGRFDEARGTPAESGVGPKMPEPHPRALREVAPRTVAPDRAATPERQPEERPAASVPSASSNEDDSHAVAEAVSDAEAADAGAVMNALARHNADAGADTGQWHTLYLKGHRFQLEGELVAAADAYRRASTLNPHHAAILYDLGYVLQIQKQPEAAMQAYRRALALAPNHAYAHYNLGCLLQEEGDYIAALEHFRSAAARLPDNPYVFYDWAASLEAIGDPTEAAKLYRRAIDIDPGQQPAVDAQRRLVLISRAARLQ